MAHMDFRIQAGVDCWPRGRSSESGPGMVAGVAGSGDFQLDTTVKRDMMRHGW